MSANKIYQTFQEAVADVQDGATILVGGFIGKPGSPTNLIRALRDQGAKNLITVSNRCAVMDLDLLFETRQVRKAIASAPVPGSRAPSPFEEQYLAGEVELEVIPQGTMVERMRAAAAGIGGFYTSTGVGTQLEEGKEKRFIEGKEYILELPLRADYAFIRAHKADKMGNLTYWRSQRNFNPVMAMAAKITIAEVDEIVEIGDLDPENIITPAIYVDRVVQRPGRED